LQLSLRLFHGGARGERTDEDVGIISPVAGCDAGVESLRLERLHKTGVLFPTQAGNLQIEIGLRGDGIPIRFRDGILSGGLT
jgi:hypothetical protein